MNPIEKDELIAALAKIAEACESDLARRVLAGEARIPDKNASTISKMAPPMRAAWARSYAETGRALPLPRYRDVIDAAAGVARGQASGGGLPAALAAVLRAAPRLPGVGVPPLDTERHGELINRLDRALGLVAKVAVDLPRLDAAPSEGELATLRERLGKMAEFVGLIQGMAGRPEGNEPSASLQPMKGTYALILRLPEDTAFERVGPFGAVTLAAGWYAYVGSAFGAGGVRARVGHHAVVEKARLHWHVDYVRPRMEIVEVWATYDAKKRECAWAGLMGVAMGGEAVIPGFGSADCKKLPRPRRCPAHFFRFADRPDVAAFRLAALGAIPGHAEVEAVAGDSVEPARARR